MARRAAEFLTMEIAERAAKTGKFRGLRSAAREYDGLIVRTTKAQAQDPDVRNAAFEVGKVAAAAGVTMRERVRDRRKLASGTWTYGTGAVRISREYAQKIGATRLSFKSSREFHRRYGRGLFSVSAGMWQALYVRTSGASGNKAILDFYGATIGMGKAVKVNLPQLRYPVRKMENQRMRNAHKAGAIHDASKGRVHILEPTWPEVIAMAAHVERVSANAIAEVFALDRYREPPLRGDPRLLQRLRRPGWGGGRI